MGSNWKKDLSGFFEEYAIIETSKKETLDDFAQFCEFIAEPAFENLSAELKEFGIRSKSRRIRGKSITFLIYFPGSRIDNFHYAICLPKNSIELRLTLRIRGRKNKKNVLEEKPMPFMDSSFSLNLAVGSLNIFLRSPPNSPDRTARKFFTLVALML